ncbi:MAG: NTP transferase domain-containing protein [Oscillospiraceae bacterium]|nr:NTP transferase domain-containing protein [Oscillospiraceae bacterium]
METMLKAVVLAAGKGTRLNSAEEDVPKVMRKIHNRPMLWYVLRELAFIDQKDTIIVAGYKREKVIDYFPGYMFAIQTEQLGTGHAVMAASTELASFDGAVLVCYGDMPALKRETYEALVNTHFTEDNDCTLLTGSSNSPLPYGRVVRDEDGRFKEVVEQRDCTPAQLEIKELNSGVYVFRSQLLLESLKNLKSDNSQGEYYLTDVPAIMRERGERVGILKRELGDEIIGVNTVEELRQVERILRESREL